MAKDTNQTADIFVRDRATGRTTRVNVTSTGHQSPDFAVLPSISGDGRFVAFQTEAKLVAGDTNGHFDVYVHDRQLGTTKRVSVSSSGANQSRGSSGFPDISDHGRFVVFGSNAYQLVVGDTNGTGDIFVRDRLRQTTTRISETVAGGQTSGECGGPVMSGDGRFIAYFIESPSAIYLYDRIAKTTQRVDVSSTGVAGDRPVNNGGIGISPEGHFVAFGSSATNLVSGDTNGRPDVFLRGPLP